MKKIFSPLNLLTIAILAFFVFKQLPIYQNNAKEEQKKLSAQSIKTLRPEGTLSFPPKGKAIVLFWSISCAPCKLEMARLASSVEDGKISKSKIFAANPFDHSESIKEFLAKNDHPFVFLEPGLPSEVNVIGTPTTLFLEDGKILKMTTGMSLTGIWSAESFLN